VNILIAATEESTDVRESVPVQTMDRFERDAVFSLWEGKGSSLSPKTCK